jgi:transposase
MSCQAQRAPEADIGVGDLLGLTLASEIGDVARFSSPRKLIGNPGRSRLGQARARRRL